LNSPRTVKEQTAPPAQSCQGQEQDLVELGDTPPHMCPRATDFFTSAVDTRILICINGGQRWLCPSAMVDNDSCVPWRAIEGHLSAIFRSASMVDNGGCVPRQGARACDFQRTHVMMTPEQCREIRKRRGLTQEEFGDRIGCSKSQVKKMEAGTRRITPETEQAVLWLDANPPASTNSPATPQRRGRSPGATTRPEGKAKISWGLIGGAATVVSLMLVALWRVGPPS
jgi:DNA-binding transcriptional regulator YiaG